MEWNYCLLIFMISLISQSYAYMKVFQHVQHRNNWTAAYNECSAQTGRLANPDEFITCPNLSSDQNIWLGQYDHKKVTPWIAKIGCYNYKNNKRTTEGTGAKSVLECFRRCKTTQFGFNHNWCSCEDTHITFEPSDTPCAAEQNRYYLWLYNMTQIDLSENNHILNCVSAQCTGNGTVFKAADCSLQKISYCQAKDGGSINTKMYTHTNSEKMCNEKQKTHFISKGVCSSKNTDKTNGPEFWTGTRRYRYNTTEIITDSNGQEVNNEDIFNCVYVRCPPKDGNGLVRNVKKCSQQLEGFACIFNGSVESISTVTQSLKSTFETTTSNTPESSSMQVESVSTIVSPKPTIQTNTHSNVTSHIQTKTRSSILPTNVTTQLTSDHTSEPVASTSLTPNGIDVSSVPAVTSNIVTQSIRNTFETTTSNTPVSSSMQFEYVSTIVSPKPTNQTNNYSSVSTYIQTKIGSSILPTNVTTQLTSDHTSEPVASTSSATKGIDGSSIPAVTDNIVTHSNGFKTVMRSSSTPTSMKFEHISPNISLQSTVQTRRRSSVSKYKQTKIRSSILPTNGITQLTSDHTGEPVASTSVALKGIDVSTVSAVTTNIDVLTATFSSVITSKYVTKNSESNSMDNTTMSHSNSAKSKKLNTGLVVGVSVSILIVVIIGLLGICRLRNRGPIKGNKEDTEIPMTVEKDPNYHGIHFDSESKASDIKNKYANDALGNSDDDMQFRLINNAQNGGRDIPDNAYAVVVKKQVTTQTKKNQDKDKNTPSNTHEDDYDVMNQPRRSSGNESGNIYDTSEGHLGNNDPNIIPQHT